MEKARYNTELYSNLRGPLNNVKPSNFWGSHHFDPVFLILPHIRTGPPSPLPQNLGERQSALQTPARHIGVLEGTNPITFEYSNLLSRPLQATSAYSKVLLPQLSRPDYNRKGLQNDLRYGWHSITSEPNFLTRSAQTHGNFTAHL